VVAILPTCELSALLKLLAISDLGKVLKLETKTELSQNYVDDLKANGYYIVMVHKILLWCILRCEWESKKNVVRCKIQIVVGG